jgi:putative hydrolase of the HAD superfamily
VITEGSLRRVARNLEHHRIAGYVQSKDAVKKDQQGFAALRARHAADSLGWVVGDQLTRDIFPARDAGLRTIYFAGSFQPQWEQSLDIGRETIAIETFASVPLILQEG